MPRLVSGSEGMSLTSEDYLIHWQSHADSKAAWDYINSDLDIDNYVKIYTSQTFKMRPDLDEKPILKSLDWIINKLALEDQRYARWGIRSLDITRQKDIVLGMNDALKARNMASNGWITLPIGTQQPLLLSCGPLISQGCINISRYEVSCRFPPRGITIESIIKQLKESAKVKEIILGNVKVGSLSAPISQNGFTAYIEFDTVEAALNFPTEMEVDGEIVKLWHRGRFECATCKEKGHSEDYHDDLMKARKREAVRRKNFRARKQARAQARRQDP